MKKYTAGFYLSFFILHRRLLAAGFFLTLLLPASGFGHEYWFEPDSFFLLPNQKTNVHLFLGEALKVEEERPFETAKTRSFRLFSLDTTRDIGKDNPDKSIPVFSFMPQTAGGYLFAMERDWSYITLEPAQFADYLREDGMEYIIAEREKLGESKAPGRERYSRFIKGLVQVGEKRDNAYKKKSGLKLDIVPLENPYSKKIGDELEFQVLFNGKPLVNKTAFADNRDGENIAKQKLITDAKGKIKVKLDQKGVWLVRLVFMQRCKTGCGEADWESFWGAFSFGLK